MLFIIANLEAFSKHSHTAYTEKYRDKKTERKSKMKETPPLIIDMSKKESPNDLDVVVL